MSDDSLRRRTVLRGVAAGAALTGAGTAAATGSDGKAPERHIIGVDGPAAAERARQVADSVRHDLSFDGSRGAVAGRFPEQALRALERRPDVRYVEPDGQMQAVGQTTPWGVDRIDADETIADGYSGDGADVAILDSGIDSDHPDLQANLGSGEAFTTCDDSCHGNDCLEPWDDDNDHGTHCAGIVAAVDDSSDVIGTAPSATLHAVKVLACDGYGYWSDIAAGLEYTADQGWDVASMSLGGDTGSATLQDACQYAESRGVLVVAAAGNSGPCSDCVLYPAKYDSVVAVSSTNEYDSLSGFSSTGPEVEIAAPGTSVLSTIPGGTAYFSGTSMATPHVAGVGGTLAVNGYSGSDARDRLGSTAEDIGLAGNESGNGLLDAGAAIGSSGGDGDSTAPTAPSSLSSPGHTSTSVDLTWDGSTDDGTGVDHYNVYVDGTKTTESADTTETVGGLDGGATYEFSVTAVDGAGNESGESDTVSVTTVTLSRPTHDSTTTSDAEFSGGDGDYTITASGIDVWSSDDDYAAVYEESVSGDVVAEVTVDSQENIFHWAKAGLMIANDVTAAGSSAGDLLVAATPGNGYAMQWDGDADGYVEESTNVDSTTYPVRLRLTKSGTQFTGEYSTDGGTTWSTIDTVSIPEANTTQDVAVFNRGSYSETKGTAEFTDFSVGPALSRPTHDSTTTGDAEFSGGDGDYTIAASGIDVWASDDDYAAVYEESVSGDIVAEVTVDSQENTFHWAKAGIMVANDVTAPGESAGDLLVAATPGNGYAMQWDGDADGYVEESTNVDSTTYPVRLRLTKSGTQFTGEYSTDGGTTWSTIDTVSIPEANTTQDVAVFNRGSYSETKGTAEFTDFTVGPP